MFQLNCDKGIVDGENGFCFSFKENKPVISVSIRGDKSSQWTSDVDFLLDSGADFAILHIDEAKKLGLDINRCDLISKCKGIKGAQVEIFLKNGILIKIGDYPAVPLPVWFARHIEPKTRILGRGVLFELFGIVFNDQKTGIFLKLPI
ncbi:MAG: aspartyl protease family protein [Deltaproteobacteria bacterium]|nr:aspartyl protease family protein [Deltaproteobacteria bacterium]